MSGSHHSTVPDEKPISGITEQTILSRIVALEKSVKSLLDTAENLIAALSTVNITPVSTSQSRLKAIPFQKVVNNVQ